MPKKAKAKAKVKRSRKAPRRTEPAAVTGMQDLIASKLSGLDLTNARVAKALEVLGIKTMPMKLRETINDLALVFDNAGSVPTVDEAAVILRPHLITIQNTLMTIVGMSDDWKVKADETRKSSAESRSSAAQRAAATRRTNGHSESKEPCPKCSQDSGKMTGHKGRHLKEAKILAEDQHRDEGQEEGPVRRGLG